MAMHYPARHLILPPVVLLLSIPVALFAWFTTTIAITVLLCRAAVVYFEMAVVVVPHYLLDLLSLLDPQQTSLSALMDTGSSPPRRRRRTDSASSLSALGSSDGSQHGHPTAALALGLSPGTGPARDYEGLGGWRLDGASDREEGPWMRSSTGAETAKDPTHRRRHHHRSLTSSAVSQYRHARLPRNRSDEAMMNISRARTPLGSKTMLSPEETKWYSAKHGSDVPILKSAPQRKDPLGRKAFGNDAGHEL